MSMPPFSDSITIAPQRRPVDFTLPVPGSKSLANRALLLAGMADGISYLDQVPDSDDILAALSALDYLGVPVSRVRPDCVSVRGTGLAFPHRDGDIHIRSSGTVGRFLPGLLAAASGGPWRLIASEQLSKRPIEPLLRALQDWGADIGSEAPGRAFPLRIGGKGLRGGTVEISAAVSSQFASALIMAAPLAERTATVTIRDLDPEERYIDLTLDTMRRFGVDSVSEKSGDSQTVTVAPQRYRAATMTIEADFNSALYFLSLPLLLGGKAVIENLSPYSGQPGQKFLDVLSGLGATTGEDAGRVVVTSVGTPLRGGFSIDMRAMSEMALTLGVLAVFADAPITMTNLAHIRGHETDRLTVLATLLARVGVRCEEGPDWIRVFPTPVEQLKSATIDSHDDHRIVMAFSLLGLAGNGLTITNPGAVRKTFPTFFRCLETAVNY